MPSRLQRVALGAAAGFAASHVMDAATSAYMSRQSETSLLRENELQPEGTPVAMARRLVEIARVDISQQQVQRLGALLHRSFGVTGGVVISTMARRRHPMPAAMLTALALWVVFDEGATVVSGSAPPARAYPLETHIRGLIGHLVYGAAVGSLLTAERVVFAE